jgi:hypothetical protein
MAATGLGLKYALPDNAFGISLRRLCLIRPRPRRVFVTCPGCAVQRDGKPEAIASKLADSSMGILLKTHDGTNWMSRWDTSMHGVSGPQQVAKLVDYFESSGVPFHAWFVAEA